VAGASSPGCIESHGRICLASPLYRSWNPALALGRGRKSCTLHSILILTILASVSFPKMRKTPEISLRGSLCSREGLSAVAAQAGGNRRPLITLGVP